jgi:hypothetical protein
MKKYTMTVASKGKFLFRTEPLEYGAFKEMLKLALDPLKSSIPHVSIIFDMQLTDNWTTYHAFIDSTNAIDILDNLAKAGE